MSPRKLLGPRRYMAGGGDPRADLQAALLPAPGAGTAGGPGRSRASSTVTVDLNSASELPGLRPGSSRGRRGSSAADLTPGRDLAALQDDALQLERAGSEAARFWFAAGWALAVARFLVWAAAALLVLKLLLVDWPEPAVRNVLYACFALFVVAALLTGIEKGSGCAGKGAAGLLAARLARATHQTLQDADGGADPVSLEAVRSYARHAFRQIQAVLSPEPDVILVPA
ncbi:MAG TPA: hypothetical protein VNI01_10160 [Elusimicrobiota bacterium]|nr:hypothetical protein [Elusimicrobiota bacterium]